MLKLGGIGTLKRTKMTLTPHEAVGVSTGEALIVGFSMTEEGPTDELGITRLKVRWTTRATKRSHIVDEVEEGDAAAGVEEVEVVRSSILHTLVVVVHGKTTPEIWK